MTALRILVTAWEVATGAVVLFVVVGELWRTGEALAQRRRRERLAGEVESYLRDMA